MVSDRIDTTWRNGLSMFLTSGWAPRKSAKDETHQHLSDNPKCMAAFITAASKLLNEGDTPFAHQKQARCPTRCRGTAISPMGLSQHLFLHCQTDLAKTLKSRMREQGLRHPMLSLQPRPSPPPPQQQQQSASQSQPYSLTDNKAPTYLDQNTAGPALQVTPGSGTSAYAAASARPPHQYQQPSATLATRPNNAYKQVSRATNPQLAGVTIETVILQIMANCPGGWWARSGLFTSV